MYGMQMVCIGRASTTNTAYSEEIQRNKHIHGHMHKTGQDRIQQRTWGRNTARSYVQNIGTLVWLTTGHKGYYITGI